MIGRSIAHYQIIEKLGGGGMGIVYKARDTRLGRFVALKFLPFHLIADPNANERFVQEAKAASALDHTNICTLFDIGTTDAGQFFIAMAFYNGRTLKYRIAEELSIENSLDIAIQIAEGLERAHEAGIVHRDIKPANVMVTDRGEVKILDFGVAKLDTSSDLTRTGSSVGTVAYMSPEQARGEIVDARTDVWALGIVLYEMLTMQRPFHGEYDQAVVYAILNKEPEPVQALRPEVPQALVQIVEKLLSKEASARYPSMAEVLVALNALRGTATGSAPYPPPRASPASHTKRRWALVSVVAVLVVLGGLWGATQFRPEAKRATPAVQTNLAVLPFSVEGDEALTYLETGMVMLLSTKFDGMGDLRSVDANALIGYIQRHPDLVLDPQQGQAIAARFEAEGFILGRILKVGGLIQINASLYDSDGAEQTNARVSIVADSLLVGAIDDLARQLISVQFSTPGQQLASMATLTSSSFPALKAFLDGEEAMQEARWEPAFQAFQRAVEADSTFALAWYRLADAAEWSTNPRVASFSASAQAVQHSGSLPGRTRQLIQAQHAYVNGRPGEAERIYRSLTTSDPKDVLAWYKLGETLNHYNRYYGRPTAKARPPFERALALNPDNEEIRHHLVELAAEEGRFEGFDTLAAGYLETLNEAQALAWRTLPALAGQGAEMRERALDQLKQAPWLATWYMLDHANAYLEDLSVAQLLAERLTTLADTQRAPASGYMRLGNFHVAQGREQEARTAYAKAESLQPYWQMLLFRFRAQGFHLLYPYPRTGLEALRDEIARWDSTRAPLFEDLFEGKNAIIQAYLLGLMDWRLGEEEAVEAHVAELDQRGAAQPNDSLAYSLARTLEGLLAWRRGEPDRALDDLNDARLRFPHWTFRQGFYDEPLIRYLRAEILFGAERYEEALPWYASLDDGGSVLEARAGVFYLGPSYLRRAQIYDQLGDNEKAIVFYTRFVDLWKDCDPELRPQVEAAQERLNRLTEGTFREPDAIADPGATV